jgi:hypothetical protein
VSPYLSIGIPIELPILSKTAQHVAEGAYGIIGFLAKESG